MKKKGLEDVAQLNEVMEPIKKQEWEVVEEERRKKLKRRPSTLPKWRWDKSHGKMARSDRGGIDFYQYWKEIQVLKLIPFTKKVNGIIVKDGCGSHSHWYI